MFDFPLGSAPGLDQGILAASEESAPQPRKWQRHVHLDRPSGQGDAPQATVAGWLKVRAKKAKATLTRKPS